MMNSEGIPLSGEHYTGMDSYYGTKGRPIAELRAPQHVVDLARNRVEFRRVSYKPTDNRANEKFSAWKLNDSSWQEFLGHRQDTLNGLAYLNANVEPQAPNVTAGEVITLSAIGSYLPLYFTSRIDNPLYPDNIPPFLAKMSQASQGISLPAHAIAHRDGEDAIVTPESLYEEANDMETEGTKGMGKREMPLLVGRDPKSLDVCPASKPMIIEALNALLYGRGGNPEESQLTGYFRTGEFSTARTFAVSAQRWSGRIDKISELIAEKEKTLEPIEFQRFETAKLEELAGLEATMTAELNAILGRE